jgi:hypothetical protein
MTPTDHRVVVGHRGEDRPDLDRRQDVAMTDPRSEDPFVSDWSDGSVTVWAGEAHRLERRRARALERNLGSQDHRIGSA